MKALNNLAKTTISAVLNNEVGAYVLPLASFQSTYRDANAPHDDVAYDNGRVNPLKRGYVMLVETDVATSVHEFIP